MKYRLGIDMGGTEIKMSILDAQDQAVLQKKFLTNDNANDPMSWADSLMSATDEMLGEFDGELLSVGVSVPGLNDKACEKILSMPGRLKGIDTFDWTQLTSRTSNVRVINDGKAALLGELHSQNFNHVSDVVMLTLGTGVGGAIMIDGKLYQGHRGVAGHIGHICLDWQQEKGITGIPGSFEDSIGNSTIAKRTNGRYTSTYDLVQDVKKYDEFAISVWLESVRKLAIAISSINNILDPEMFILGGGILNAGDELFNPLYAYLKEYQWAPTNEDIKLVPAVNGTWAGSIGAALLGKSYN